MSTVEIGSGAPALTVAELTALVARLGVDIPADIPADPPDDAPSGERPGVVLPPLDGTGHDDAFAVFVAARDAARAGRTLDHSENADGTDTTRTADAQRIDRIRALEAIKAAAAAAQAREVTAFAASQHAAQQAQGLGQLTGRGIPAQIGLAMRSSHHAAARFTNFSRMLVTQLPHTLAALSAGKTTERRALLLAQHTAWLRAEDRATIDTEIGPHLEAMSDRQVENTVRARAAALDPEGLVARQRRAERDRRVTTRPAPDTMAYLTALLPAAAAIACKARLKTAADALKAAGDPRTHSQIEADLLLGAITGTQPLHGIPTRDGLDHVEDLTDLDPDDLTDPPAHDASASTKAEDQTSSQPAEQPAGQTAEQANGEPAAPTHTPDSPTRAQAQPSAAGSTPGGFVALPAGATVDLKLVMTDRALFGGDDEPAHLEGYGPVPAAWVREMLRHSDPAARVFLRRVYTAPTTGTLAAIDSRAREFTGALRQLILARDQFCRHPWCGAPIRHLDHVIAHHQGGPTSLTNAQGLCQACNHAKQAPGWHTEPDPHDAGVVHTTTPTGHRYTSRPPDPPGHTQPDNPAGATEPAARRHRTAHPPPEISILEHLCIEYGLAS
jgi:hypothetical protein